MKKKISDLIAAFLLIFGILSFFALTFDYITTNEYYYPLICFGFAGIILKIKGNE